jgi:hypothetical protein
MAIVVTLAPQYSPIKVGTNAQINMVVRNTGGSDVTLSSVSTYFLPATAPGFITQPQFPGSSTMVVVASSTLTLNFSVSLFAPTVAGAPAAASSVRVGATVYSNDATTPVATVEPIYLGIAPEETLTQGQNPTAPGWLDFTQAGNLIDYMIFST